MPPTATPRSTALSYPKLCQFTPVLRRGPGVLQIGLDQERALILVDVPPGMSTLMTLLDGCHHHRDICSAAVDLGITSSALEWALCTLAEAGVLTEGDPSSTSPEPLLPTQRVRLVGAGRLGREIGELLYRSGLGVLDVVDNSVPDAVSYPGGGAFGTQAEAFRHFLGEPGPARVRVANHWSKPEGVRVDLTVIVSEEMECDRVLTDHLVRADEPHLLVRRRAGGVLVGPLVQPGMSACVRCTDLTRRDADPAWPTLLPQLQRTRVPVTAALTAWAAGVATAQVLAFLDGHRAESSGATLEIAPNDHITHRRTWPMHPACGCGWHATAQWGS